MGLARRKTIFGRAGLSKPAEARRKVEGTAKGDARKPLENDETVSLFKKGTAKGDARKPTRKNHEEGFAQEEIGAKLGWSRFQSLIGRLQT